MKIYYHPKLKERARSLRKKGTKAEALLWLYLKGRKIGAYQFTRQKPIGNYIVDFYCSKLRLAIEIDGISHDDKLEYDRQRQRQIESQGVRFLRFSDEDVRENLEDVVQVIADWVENENRLSNDSVDHKSLLKVKNNQPSHKSPLEKGENNQPSHKSPLNGKNNQPNHKSPLNGKNNQPNHKSSLKGKNNQPNYKSPLEKGENNQPSHKSPLEKGENNQPSHKSPLEKGDLGGCK
ncbi:MAG: endonuclease domain-containing protein [Syntrophaceae bacterium]|nr:endonuclease domain-containing protein [Syntrophaceae bacterium]